MLFNYATSAAHVKHNSFSCYFLVVSVGSEDLIKQSPNTLMKHLYGYNCFIREKVL